MYIYSVKQCVMGSFITETK
uniref:Uncharacterized protein n=1 Tax=Anguilla anguilla TaxID=7936 RepID=A0A0E9VUA0_ANGAN